MRLIANKPCSFGGKQFFVGDEIPADLVADAQLQAKYGVLTITNDDGGVSGGQSGTSLSSEDMAELQEYRELGVTPQQIREMDESYAALAKELGELKSKTPPAGEIVIYAKGFDYSENGGVAAEIPATPDEIKMVFGILQMTAEEVTKAIADVKEKNVLALIYSVDSRKTVKDAAKKQADTLSSAESN